MTFKLQALLIENDLRTAGDLVEEIRPLAEEILTSFGPSGLYAAMSMVHYCAIRLSGEPDAEKKQIYRREMMPMLKKLVKKRRLMAMQRLEACRVIGKAFWVIGRQRKALAFWLEGLQEARRLGWRMEAGRLAMEIGRRLSEPVSRHKGLDGKSSQHYLQSAEGIFADLGLE